ncbi:unnamed protein product [Vitrella brassicaformis CCMP3155]|uniref:F5/8 type C domain-containing protein n=1 Tax=Vitrella brassicaformis (strain CCMP3155) TaxID=1169540 RepID=A0A0G4H7P5_VITBC|nr:unnamed protein product [Vitrella brassicaformis CCMP3155]|eukprot:CEM39928.1 unnamed protein product [Vitrella brassicaformis CCMP3155]
MDLSIAKVIWASSNFNFVSFRDELETNGPNNFHLIEDATFDFFSGSFEETCPRNVPYGNTSEPFFFTQLRVPPSYPFQTYLAQDYLDNPFAANVTNNNFVASYITTDFFPDDDSAVVPHDRDQFCHYGLRVVAPSASKRAIDELAWGAAIYRFRQLITYGFSTRFTFMLLHKSVHCTAASMPSRWCFDSAQQGFAFVLQNVLLTDVGSGAVAFWPTGEDGLGYRLTQGLAIEFDTYRDADAMDPNANHLSVQSRITAANQDNHANEIHKGRDLPDLKQGTHEVFISFSREVSFDDLLPTSTHITRLNPEWLDSWARGDLGLLIVTVDEIEVLRVPVDINNIADPNPGNTLTATSSQGGDLLPDEKGPGRSYVGFTGACGSPECFAVDILSWQFTETRACPASNITSCESTSSDPLDEKIHIQNAARKEIRIAAHFEGAPPLDGVTCKGGEVSWDPLHPYWLGCVREVRFPASTAALWVTDGEGQRKEVIQDAFILNKAGKGSLFQSKSETQWCVTEHATDPMRFYFGHCSCEKCVRYFDLQKLYVNGYQYDCALRYGTTCRCFETSNMTWDFGASLPDTFQKHTLCTGCKYNSHCNLILPFGTCRARTMYRIGNPLTPTPSNFGIDPSSPYRWGRDPVRTPEGGLYLDDVTGLPSFRAPDGYIWGDDCDCSTGTLYPSTRNLSQTLNVFPERTVTADRPDCYSCLEQYPEGDCALDCGVPLAVPLLHYPDGAACSTCLLAGINMEELTLLQKDQVYDCVSRAIGDGIDPWTHCETEILTNTGFPVTRLFSGLATHYLAECPGRPFPIYGALCAPNMLSNTVPSLINDAILSKFSATNGTVWSDEMACLNSICEFTSREACYSPLAEWPFTQTDEAGLPVDPLRDLFGNLNGSAYQGAEVRDNELQLNKSQEQYVRTEPLGNLADGALTEKSLEVWVRVSTEEAATNAAAGKPVTTNSLWEETVLPEKVVDSDLSTYWAAQLGQTSAEVLIDLGTDTNLGRVKVFFAWPPQSYTLRTQLDGTSTWVLFQQNNTNDQYDLDFLVPSAGRFFQLQLSSPAFSHPDFGPMLAVKEVETYADIILSHFKSGTVFAKAEYSPELAVDGDPLTYWALPPGTDTAILLVDLGGPAVAIDVIRLTWKASPAAFTLETSPDGLPATYVVQQSYTGGGGGVALTDFEADAASPPLVQFVRLELIEGAEMLDNRVFVAVRELTAFGRGTNVALGQVAYGTDTNDMEEYPASLAVDGDPNTYWASGPKQTHANWYVDLGTERLIDNITILWEDAPAAFNLSISDDNATFTLLDGDASLPPGTNVTDFAAVPSSARGRYVRVAVEGPTGVGPQGDGWPAFTVNEVTVWEAAKNLAHRQPITATNEAKALLHPSSNAVDGSLATYWLTPSGTTAAVFKVDLGTADTVVKTSVDWEYYARDFSIQHSTDDATWTTLASYTMESSASHSVTQMFVARYLKIDVTQNGQTDGFGLPVIGIQEVTVKLRDTNNIALGIYAEATGEDVFGNTFTHRTSDPPGWPQPVNYAVDGDPNTWWEAGGVADLQKANILFALNATRECATFILRWKYPGLFYDLLGSTDLSTWTTFYSKTDISAPLDVEVNHVGTFRYIQLDVSATGGFTNPSGRQVIGLTSFEVYTAINGAFNQRTAATHTALVTPVVITHPAANLVDTDTNTTWLTEANTNAASVDIDLEASYDIQGIGIDWTWPAQDFTVQSSPDSTTWTTRATVAGNAASSSEVEAQFTARYVRIAITQAALNDFDDQPILGASEIRVYQLNPAARAGVSVTATSEEAGYGAALGADGLMSTYWMTLPNQVTATLTIDLGSVQELMGIDLRWMYRAESYEIRISEAGVFTSTYMSLSGNTDDTNTRRGYFRARYLYLETFNGVQRDPSNFRRIGLFEIYLIPARNAALNRPATASSVDMIDTHPPNNTVDGNLATYWRTLPNITEATVQVDLSGVRQLVGLRVDFEYAAGEVDVISRVGGGSDVTVEAFTGNVAAFVQLSRLFDCQFLTLRLRQPIDVDGSGWPAFGIQEIELYEAVDVGAGVQTVAGTAPPHWTYSSPAQEYLPFAAIDQQLQTFWLGPFGQDALTFEADIGSVQPIDTITILWKYPAADFTIAVDGAVVETVVGNSDYNTTYTMPVGLTGQLVSVDITTAAPASTYYGLTLIGIYELEGIASGVPHTLSAAPGNPYWSYPLTNALDGDFDTSWYSRVEAQTAELKVDLASVQVFKGGIYIHWLYPAAHFRISGSVDNVAWTLLAEELIYNTTQLVYHTQANVRLSARYVKLDLLRPMDAQRTLEQPLYAIKEFKVDQGTNSALGEPATASTEANATYVATNANDGDDTTAWRAQEGLTSATWTVDMGGTFELEGIEIDWDLKARSFNLWLANDTVDFGTASALLVDSVAANTLDQTTHAFLAVGRYVRLEVTNTLTLNENGFLQIGVKEFRTSLNYNVAVGASVTASSTWQYPAEWALDDNDDTSWVSALGEAPAHIDIDLEYIQPLSAVTLKWWYEPKTYSIQYSVDRDAPDNPGTYVTMDTINIPAPTVNATYDSPLIGNARFVRVIATSFHAGCTAPAMSAPATPYHLGCDAFGLREARVWVNQGGGGVMSVQTADGSQFDAIVFEGGDGTGQWRIDSDDPNRATPVGWAGPVYADETGQMVHIVATWGANQTVTLYRNGVVYGSPYQTAAGTPHASFDSTSDILFGLHSTAILLAQGQPASASSSYSVAREAGSAVDGLIDTSWLSQDGVATATWQVDLGAVQGVGTIEIIWDYPPQQFDVYLSTTLATLTNPASLVRTVVVDTARLREAALVYLNPIANARYVLLDLQTPQENFPATGQPIFGIKEVQVLRGRFLKSPFFSGRIAKATLYRNELMPEDVFGLYNNTPTPCHCGHEVCPAGNNRYFPSVPVPCSGQGVCLVNGTCVCSPGSFGPSCSSHCHSSISPRGGGGCCQIDDDCPPGQYCIFSSGVCDYPPYWQYSHVTPLTQVVGAPGPDIVCYENRTDGFYRLQLEATEGWAWPYTATRSECEQSCASRTDGGGCVVSVWHEAFVAANATTDTPFSQFQLPAIPLSWRGRCVTFTQQTYCFTHLAGAVQDYLSSLTTQLAPLPPNSGFSHLLVDSWQPTAGVYGSVFPFVSYNGTEAFLTDFEDYSNLTPIPGAPGTAAAHPELRYASVWAFTTSSQFECKATCAETQHCLVYAWFATGFTGFFAEDWSNNCVLWTIEQAAAAERYLPGCAVQRLPDGAPEAGAGCQYPSCCLWLEKAGAYSGHRKSYVAETVMRGNDSTPLDLTDVDLLSRVGDAYVKLGTGNVQEDV